LPQLDRRKAAARGKTKVGQRHLRKVCVMRVNSGETTIFYIDGPGGVLSVTAITGRPSKGPSGKMLGINDHWPGV